jgi:site-specific DNA-cytosine methylase
MHGLRALISLVLGVALAALATPAPAQVTEIYKCLDPTGRPLYTSDKKDTEGKKCELVSREINVVPAQKIPVPKAAPRENVRRDGFPRESPAAQASAKERQREILEKELAAEQELLANAKQELADQETIRNGDERNFARVQERLQPYKDTVDLHEKNVEALRRELGNSVR